MKPLGILTCLLVGMTMALATTPTPFISVDSGGNLFAAPFSQDDPGDANLTTLCNRLGMGRDDLLIALHVYMEREKHVVFVPNPNRAYFNALISVVAADSGLNTLLDAAYTNGALPNTRLSATTSRQSRTPSKLSG